MKIIVFALILIGTGCAHTPLGGHRPYNETEKESFEKRAKGERLGLGDELVIWLYETESADEKVKDTHDVQYVQIDSDPPGARIEINNQYVGDTPIYSLRIARPKLPRLTEYSQVKHSELKITATPIENGLCPFTKVIHETDFTPLKMIFDNHVCGLTSMGL